MYINENVTAEQSMVLRYGKNLHSIHYDYLKQASIQEGAAVVPLIEYKGVALWLLDLSTLSETNTFKASLGCVAIAHCLKNKLNRLVFQSSGNTGNALAAYARQHDLQSILFYPKASRYKIDPALFDNQRTFAIECDVSEPDLKKLVASFSQKFDIELMPTLDHQIEANKLRAYFLLEHYKNTDQWFDWHSQAISTGFGVFGLYHGFDELKQSGNLPKYKPLPRLLAIQQAAVQPYVQSIAPTEVPPIQDKTISPTLFRTMPSSNEIAQMRDIIEQSNGHITAIAYEVFSDYKQKAIDLLHSIDIKLGSKMSSGSEILVEETGLLSLVGSLKAIDENIIVKGESLLVTFTGGSKKLTAHYTPQYTISAEHIEEQLESLAKVLEIPKRIL